jgi:hypothetical protein
MNLREAAQMALMVLENVADEVFSPYNDPIGKAILDLRAALEQPEQEPYCYRDYFAARAMQPLIVTNSETSTMQQIAEASYLMADAMIKERERAA